MKHKNHLSCNDLDYPYPPELRFKDSDIQILWVHNTLLSSCYQEVTNSLRDGMCLVERSREARIRESSCNSPVRRMPKGGTDKMERGRWFVRKRRATHNSSGYLQQCCLEEWKAMHLLPNSSLTAPDLLHLRWDKRKQIFRWLKMQNAELGSFLGI